MFSWLPITRLSVSGGPTRILTASFSSFRSKLVFDPFLLNVEVPVILLLQFCQVLPSPRLHNVLIFQPTASSLTQKLIPEEAVGPVVLLYLRCDRSELVVAVQVEFSAVGVAAEVQRLIPVDSEAKNAQEEHPH